MAALTAAVLLRLSIDFQIDWKTVLRVFCCCCFCVLIFIFRYESLLFVCLFVVVVVFYLFFIPSFLPTRLVILLISGSPLKPEAISLQLVIFL